MPDRKWFAPVVLATEQPVPKFEVHRFLAESLPVRQSLHPLAIARNYARLFRNPMYLCAVVGSGFVYAGLLTYLSSSSFVYINMLGVPVQYFGLIFLTSVVGYMAGSGLSARLSRTADSEYIVLWGALLGAVSTASMWVAASVLTMTALKPTPTRA